MYSILLLVSSPGWSEVMIVGALSWEDTFQSINFTGKTCFDLHVWHGYKKKKMNWIKCLINNLHLYIFCKRKKRKFFGCGTFKINIVYDLYILSVATIVFTTVNLILKVPPGKRSRMLWLPWQRPLYHWPFTGRRWIQRLGGPLLSVCWQPDRLTSPTPIKRQYTGNKPSSEDEPSFPVFRPTRSAVSVWWSWFCTESCCITLSVIVLWCTASTV